MRVKRLSNFCFILSWWAFRLFCPVCIMLLMILDGSVVSGQTATPQPFITLTPAATGTPGGAGLNDVVHFGFKGGQGTFAVTLGSWASGIGFQSASGILTVFGGYQLDEITKVTLHYSSTTAGDMDFGIQSGSPPPDYEASGGFSVCATECTIFFSLSPAVSGDLFLLAVDVGAGDFVLTAMDVEFEGESEAYDVDDEGCPILDAGQLSSIDPLYYSQCAHCFVTPTPVRDSLIPTVALPAPTLDLTVSSTFEIPVIVSGTPQTRTPAPAGGGLFTATPTSTVTVTPGGATATPHFEQVIFDFTDGGQHTWIPMNYPATWGDQVVTFSVGGIQSVFTASPSAREYIQIDRLAAAGSITGVTAIGFQYTTLGDNGGGIIWEVYDTNGASLTSLIAGSTVGGTGTSLNQTYILGSPVTLSGWGVNAYTGVLGGTNHWYLEKILLTTTNVVTATPALTSTPNPTGAPWIVTPVTEDVDCSVAVFGDFEPVAQFEDTLRIVSVECYTIIPEVHIDIPGNDPLDIDGVQWCITWYEFPIISVLGITVTLDWLLVVVVAWMIRALLSF